MTIYQIIEYNKSDKLNFWHCFFRRAAIRKASRIASNFSGQSEPCNEDAVARFVNPKAPEYLVLVLAMTLTFVEPWAAVRRWFRKLGHAQNLNEDRKGKVKGSIWRHGRAWINPRGRHSGRGTDINIEWVFFNRFTGLALEMGCFGGDSDRDLRFNCSFLFGSLYLTFEGLLPRKWAAKHQYEHGTGFYWKEDNLRFELWHGGDDCYRCQGWKGWYKHIFVREAILGKTKYASRILESAVVPVQMPEAAYPAKIEIREDSWTHSRWPIPRKVLRAHIDIEKGIPTPGKGENSWDCGEDATYGLTCQATSIDDAAAKLRNTVMESRERYGGKNWRPLERKLA